MTYSYSSTTTHRGRLGRHSVFLFVWYFWEQSGGEYLLDGWWGCFRWRWEWERLAIRVSKNFRIQAGELQYHLTEHHNVFFWLDAGQNENAAVHALWRLPVRIRIAAKLIKDVGQFPMKWSWSPDLHCCVPIVWWVIYRVRLVLCNV